MAERRHPGITIHKLSFGGGFMGLTFALGSALIFLLGFPTLWYFVALAAALGIGVAAFLRISNEARSNRTKPLSILSVLDVSGTRKVRERMKWHEFFRIPTNARFRMTCRELLSQ